MSIEARIQDEMKRAMREKDTATLSCVRQVKAKVLEVTKSKGFSGKVDDALYLDVISAYVKSLQKALGELVGGGASGEKLTKEYQAEIDYLKRYLPEILGEEETRAIVRDAVAALPDKDPKQVGRVMGGIMKDHKGKVDAGLVRKLVEEALAG